MNLIRLLLGVCGVALAALIIWAISTGDFRAEGAWLTSNPWGIVSLADLYLGLLISAVLIALVERPVHAALWIIPLPFLGNVWTVIWFLSRFATLFARLTAKSG